MQWEQLGLKPSPASAAWLRLQAKRTGTMLREIENHLSINNTSVLSHRF